MSDRNCVMSDEKKKKSKQGLIFFEYFQPKEITKFVGGNKIRD